MGTCRGGRIKDMDSDGQLGPKVFKMTSYRNTCPRLSIQLGAYNCTWGAFEEGEGGF